MTPEQQSHMEGKIDKVAEELVTLRLSVENRVTTLETKSGLWGVLGGIVGGFLTGIKLR